MEQKLYILINKSSGTVRRLGEESVLHMLDHFMGDRIGSIQILETPALIARLKTLVRDKTDGLLIGGGDGTVAAAADITAAQGVPFGVLPLGTMNLLAQDLGAAPTFEETVQRFSRLVRDDIDAGSVNGRPFLCSAVVGFVPESAVAREELREDVSLEAMARFLSTIQRGMSGDASTRLYLKSKPGDRAYPIDTTSLIVSNNAFVRNPGDASKRFLRETLHDGTLAVYSAAPRDMMDGLKMALSLWQGDWQEHESIRFFETPELIVEADSKDIMISLDGEPATLKGPLYFGISPKSLPVYRMELSA